MIPITDALAKVETNIFFGSGQSVPIHLDELQCRGTEQNLLECEHDPVGVTDCTHEEDAGVICERSEGIRSPFSKILTLN